MAPSMGPCTVPWVIPWQYVTYYLVHGTARVTSWFIPWFSTMAVWTFRPWADRRKMVLPWPMACVLTILYTDMDIPIVGPMAYVQWYIP